MMRSLRFARRNQRWIRFEGTLAKPETSTPTLNNQWFTTYEIPLDQVHGVDKEFVVQGSGIIVGPEVKRVRVIHPPDSDGWIDRILDPLLLQHYPHIGPGGRKRIKAQSRGVFRFSIYLAFPFLALGIWYIPWVQTYSRRMWNIPDWEDEDLSYDFDNMESPSILYSSEKPIKKGTPW